MNTFVSNQDGHLRAIVKNLLDQADIVINGDRPHDIKVHHPQLYSRIMQEGSLGLGESYMDGWWDCERLDIFFIKYFVRNSIKNCQII
ncbi:MAG: hypothetical protein ACN6NX_12840 [Acinetobacter sp.]